MARPSTEERFWKYVSPEPNTGCWLWTGALGGGNYGAFQGETKQLPAHRWSFQHFVGSIPVGLQLDHKCRVRSCVNPAHLEPVTCRENLRRGLLGKRWCQDPAHKADGRRIGSECYLCYENRRVARGQRLLGRSWSKVISHA